MTRSGVDWRRRLRRRFPAALLGAQLWLTTTWLPTLSANCFQRGRGLRCPLVADPAAPLLLVGALVAGLLATGLALAVPTRWLDALGESVSTFDWFRERRVRTHVGATAVLLGTALLAPRFFLGDLGADGVAWAVAAVPVAPALLVLFGTLSLGMLTAPLVSPVPDMVALVTVCFLVLLVAVLQIGFYYGLVALAGRLLGGLRHRTGLGRDAAER